MIKSQYSIYMLEPDTYGIERDGIIFARVPEACLKHAQTMVGIANEALEKPSNKPNE